MLTTLATALAAGWLAQAEPAPPEPAPALPPASDPGPAELAPAQPAPGPAEPAAEEPGAPRPRAEPEPTARPRASSMGVAARVAVRLGNEGSSLGPQVGFSIGATYQRRYLPLGDVLSLGVAVDLYHDHFSEDVQSAQPINGALESPPDAQRVISQTSFAALQTLGADLHAVTIWLGVGGGLTFASLTTPETALAPGSLSALQPLGRAAVGVDVAVAERTAIVVRADVTHPLTHPELTTTTNMTVRPFGDLFDAGVGVLYRF
ncbi:MAG TPA: hypothetical protein VHJ20_23320 [Polyangia bacterium]|nr:hypothetical protein [Polyangia bacterium]